MTKYAGCEQGRGWQERYGIHQKTKSLVKVMVWMGVYGQQLSKPVIFEDGTMDAQRYIDKVLPIALKCGNNKMWGNNWAYQQDDARSHTHHLSQKWCADHFLAFISKDRWPPNLSDLCPFNYGLWDELGGARNWKRISTKATLIEEIKCAVEKIEKENIKNSVLDFTVRLCLIKTNGAVK